MRIYIFAFWLPLAIASTIIMLAAYVGIQQNYRMSLNDPQIALAEDGARLLTDGMTPAELVGSSRIDMNTSLTPFVIVYDDAGNVVASSGSIHDQVPILPAGVFDYARSHDDDRITWQPASTTRIAAVVRHLSGKISGFVAVGRNMREIENRVSQLGLIMGSAWIGLLVLTFVAVLYAWAVEKKASANRR